MKVIDLLNKIAKGELEENTKFKYRSIEYIYHKDWDGIWDIETGNIELFKNIYINRLNDPVIIIEEEKEIEELKFINIGFDGIEIERTPNNNELKDKINELVRELNKIKKEGK